MNVRESYGRYPAITQPVRSRTFGPHGWLVLETVALASERGSKRSRVLFHTFLTLFEKTIPCASCRSSFGMKLLDYPAFNNSLPTRFVFDIHSQVNKETGNQGITFSEALRSHYFPCTFLVFWRSLVYYLGFFMISCGDTSICGGWARELLLSIADILDEIREPSPVEQAVAARFRESIPGRPGDVNVKGLHRLFVVMYQVATRSGDRPPRSLQLTHFVRVLERKLQYSIPYRLYQRAKGQKKTKNH